MTSPTGDTSELVDVRPLGLSRAKIDRALTLYIPEPNTGCWLWEGYVTRQGYGITSRAARAHRVIYEAIVGPIPEGMQLDHKCRVRCCVNPAHLEPVTARENSLRGIGPAAQNYKKDMCKHGHPFTEENTAYRNRNGYRHRTCKACERATNAIKNGERNRRLAEQKRLKNGTL